MLDKSKLIPFKVKHSVSEVIFTLFLTNPIVNPKGFESLLFKGQPLQEKFQRFAFNIGINFKVNPVENLSGVQPQISKTGQDGFSMEAYKDGKPDWVIRYQPKTNLIFSDFLSFHCLEYDRWNTFYDQVFSYCKIISDFDPSIFINAYALNYLDQFNWTDKELPQMSDIFKSESDYLPKLIFETQGPWNFTGSYRKQMDSQLVAENAGIGINQIAINNYNIFLLHQTSHHFNESRKLRDICTEKEELKTFADQLHNLNKDFLNKTLADEILIDIGVKK